MADTTTGPLRHWTALDGVRAISIAMVLAVHAELPHLQGSLVGVDVFFVISGFLITWLLIGEHDKRDRVSLRNFYIRRALRLFPALVVGIVVALLVIAVGRAAGQGSATLAGLPFVIFYLGDFARAFGPSNELGLLGVTWSLAIEEQFYLVWPFLFLLAARRRLNRGAVAGVLAGLAVADMAYRLAMIHAGEPLSRVSYGIDTRCDGLLLGCALAFWLAWRGERPLARAAGRALHAVTVVGLAALVVVVIRGGGLTPSTFEYGIPVAVVTAAAVILTIVARPLRPLSVVLSLRPLVWLGKRSYGLYLVHYPIFVAVHADGGPYARVAAGVILSLLVAEVSFRLVESPALRLKRRFQRTEAMPPLPSPTA